MTRQEAVTKIIQSGIMGPIDVFTKNKQKIEEYIRADSALDAIEKFFILYILDSKSNLCIDALVDIAQSLYISTERLKTIISSMEDRGYIITGSLGVGRMSFRSINPQLIEKIVK
jgi:hypothetical protein